ncbi:unnamed protein product, partial [marine sediment metagenome]
MGWTRDRLDIRVRLHTGARLVTKDMLDTGVRLVPRDRLDTKNGLDGRVRPEPDTEARLDSKAGLDK